MIIKLENCPICKENKWHDLDYLRSHKYWYDLDLREEGEAVGFKICKECGFCTYDYVNDKRLETSYNQARPVMTANHIITCNRKNEYHRAFLKDVEIEGPFLDVGCAQGSFLNDLRENRAYEKVTKIEDCDTYYGTEWSKAFANYGRHEYGIQITQEIDIRYIYNFVSYYHVLEHIQHPDKELERIKTVMRDDALLYISVPLWFDVLEEWSGSFLRDWENYLHLNHVNVFSKQSFHNLLNNAGFEIIKEDEALYGYTVLCKRGEKKDIVKEDYKIQQQILEANKKAIELVDPIVNKPQEAYKVFSKFPDAYFLHAMNKDNMKNFEAQKAILEEGLKQCPNSSRLINQLAKMYFQWDESTPEKMHYSNHIKKAEELFKKCIEMKPGVEDSCYFLALIESRYKKNQKKAVEYMKETIRINPQRFTESWNMICLFYKDA